MKKGRSVVVALALAIGLVGLAAACASDGEQTTVKKTPGATETGGGDKPAIAKLGETIRLEDISYSVTKVQVSKWVGSSWSRMAADGIFVVVSLDVKNHRDEEAGITEDGIHFVAANGHTYTSSRRAAGNLEDQLIVAEELQPGERQKIVVVYDVSKKALKGAKLVVTDYKTQSTRTFDLDL